MTTASSNKRQLNPSEICDRVELYMKLLSFDDIVNAMNTYIFSGRITQLELIKMYHERTMAAKENCLLATSHGQQSLHNNLILATTMNSIYRKNATDPVAVRITRNGCLLCHA